MRTVSVAPAQVAGKRAGAVRARAVGEAVRPLAKERLDERFRLAVGLQKVVGSSPSSASLIALLRRGLHVAKSVETRTHETRAQSLAVFPGGCGRRSGIAASKVSETLVPKLEKLPRLVGYYLIEAGNGVFSSLSLFETR